MQKNKVGFRRRLGVLALALALGAGVSVVAAAPAMAAVGNIPSPFGVGQSTCVYEGYNSGTHTGTSKYGLDLVTGNCNSTSASGLSVYAPLAGTVAYTPGSTGDLCINVSGRSYTLTHIATSLTSGASVSAGQLVGTVGAPGSYGNNGVSHVHFQIWSTTNCWNSNTIPFDSADSARICGAPDLPSTGGSGSNGMWSGTTWTSSTCGTASSRSLTGDNKADLFWYEAWNSGTGKVVPTNSTGTGSGTAAAWITGWTTPPTWAGLGDFNGDGKTDLAWYDASIGGGTMKVELSSGSGFSSQVTWFTGWSAPTRVFVGDFDGDGRDDLAWYDATTGGGTMTVIQTVASGSTVASGPSTVWFTGWSNPQWADVGDFNGDGLADIAWMNSGTLSIVTTTKSGSTIGSGPSTVWFTGWSAPTNAVVGDFNGDGLADLGWYENWASGGTLFVIPTTKSGSTIGSGSAVTWFTGWSTPTRLFAGDFTGDGNADIGWYNGSTLYVIATNKSGSTIGSGTAYTWFSGWGNADFAAVG